MLIENYQLEIFRACKVQMVFFAVAECLNLVDLLAGRLLGVTESQLRYDFHILWVPRVELFVIVSNECAGQKYE